MKKWFFIATLAVLAGFTSCGDDDDDDDDNTKKEEVNPNDDEKGDDDKDNNKKEEEQEPVGQTYERPSWKEMQVTDDYAYTMTAVFALQGKMQERLQDNDIMGAFVGDECRAVAMPKNGVFVLNILGTADEESKVTIRYWSGAKSYIYEIDAPIDYAPDRIYGVVDYPETFSGKPL